MKVYAVLTASGKSTVEVFAKRREAEGFVEEVRQDEPELAAMLGVEAIELGEPEAGSNREEGQFHLIPLSSEVC